MISVYDIPAVRDIAGQRVVSARNSADTVSAAVADACPTIDVRSLPAVQALNGRPDSEPQTVRAPEGSGHEAALRGTQ